MEKFNENRSDVKQAELCMGTGRGWITHIGFGYAAQVSKCGPRFRKYLYSVTMF